VVKLADCGDTDLMGMRMRVLWLPVNIASQMQIVGNAMRDLGVDARGLVRDVSLSQSSESLERYQGSPAEHRRYSPPWLWRHMVAAWRVVLAIRWADVVHYQYGGTRALPAGLGVVWTCALRRPRLISFWGSDIRIPEFESRDNPYFARRDQTYAKWANASYERSRRLQSYYARRGFTCVVGSETMLPHIQPDLFPIHHLVRCAVDTRRLQPLYPDPGRREVVVVHSPSDPVAKGTQAVLSAVEALRCRDTPAFRLLLVTNVHRQQALDLLKTADIYLDQFVTSGYGMGAIEAMAMGKAVVSYISPPVAPLFPPDLPIVNANQDNLADVLEELLKDGRLRRELGRRGRAYVEKYHDAHHIARQLVAIYRELIAKNGGTLRRHR